MVFYIIITYRVLLAILTYRGLLCFLDVEYFLSDNNGLCSDLEALAINTSSECRSSISKIQHFQPNAYFNADEESSIWPKGCYIIGDEVWWNNDRTGSRSESSRQICVRQHLSGI